VQLRDGDLVLRAWRDDDVPAIVEACSDPDTALWLDRLPSPYGALDARTFLEHARTLDAVGSAEHFAIDLDGRLAGSITVRFDFWEPGDADVGYWVAPWARRRGVATRALVLVASLALRERGVARLQLRADVDNAASLAVAERAGFVRDGVIRAARLNVRRGRRVDLALYSLLPGELR
jgi:RimJ/RimL family protein N-acetyltransferase